MIYRLTEQAGTWLLAADRRGAFAAADAGLARHTRAAHRTWGVCAGLTVRRVGPHVTVDPGTGVDPCGRLRVLAAPARLDVPSELGPDRAIVLRGRGQRIAARAMLIEPADRLLDNDIPLGRLDTDGAVHAGDGDRVWSRRPSPLPQRHGLLRRGAGISDGGTQLEWSAHVSFDPPAFTDVPHVVAEPIGRPPEVIVATTADITWVDPSGFSVTVRHYVAVADQSHGGPTHSARIDLAWLAVLPADRIGSAPLEEDR